MTDTSNVKGKETAVSRSVLSKSHVKVTDISWAIVFSGFLCGLLVVGYEFLIWLKTELWPGIPFYTVFTYLNIDPFTPVYGIEWPGIKKTLLWFLRLPLFLMTMALGAGLGGLFNLIFMPKNE